MNIRSNTCLFVQLYTFGCNDEGALGRDTTVEGTETEPALVEGLENIIQVTAGDSHTAALTEDGRVFAFGNFRVHSSSDSLPAENGLLVDHVHFFSWLAVVAQDMFYFILIYLEC